MADYLSLLDFSIDDGAVDDDNSNNGDTGKLPDRFKEILPFDFKEYMDKELECLPLWTYSKLFYGCVFWSRKDNKPERPPTLSDDILDFNKKIRDVLCTTLDAWPYCTLVQFWAPITTSEGRFFLTTQNQPFALNTSWGKLDTALVIGLLKYRMISKDYKFYMDLDGESSEEEIGLLGRVFKHKLLESTPNVEYYSITEYPQRNDALSCQVRQSLAFPLFERSTQRCVGVLEVVTPMYCFNWRSLIWDCSDSVFAMDEDLLVSSPLTNWHFQSQQLLISQISPPLNSPNSQIAICEFGGGEIRGTEAFSFQCLINIGH